VAWNKTFSFVQLDCHGQPHEEVITTHYIVRNVNHVCQYAASFSPDLRLKDMSVKLVYMTQIRMVIGA